MVVSITVLERVTYQLSVLPWLMRFCLSHFNLTKFWKHISLTNEHACGNVVFAEDQYLRVWITDIRQTTLLPFILPSSIESMDVGSTCLSWYHSFLPLKTLNSHFAWFCSASSMTTVDTLICAGKDKLEDMDVCIAWSFPFRVLPLEGQHFKF